jgi:hypothetical protein
MTRLIIIMVSGMLLLGTGAKSSEEILNLKDCYNVFVGTSSLFSKKDKNFNINFATKKITEVLFYEKDKQSTSTWDIIHYDNGVVEAKPTGYKNDFKKPLLMVLLEEKLVIHFFDLGISHKYKCASLDNKKIKPRY